MIKTRLTEMLGIKYPIMCGGMMRLAYPPLCAAISNAGGLGNLTSAMYDGKESLKAAIGEVRKMTDKPFLVNVTLLPSIALGPEQYKGLFDACAEERVPAMEIGGVPLDRFEGGKYLKKLKDAGVRLFHMVGSVKHGQHAEEAGYDGVIADGVEEGGHPRQDPEGAYAAVIPKWIATMIRGDEVRINGSGGISRDFCHVANVVQANLLAATVARPEALNQAYNIAVGARTTLDELFVLLRDRLAARRPGLAGSRPVYGPPRPGDVLHSLADISKARRLLGYEPTHSIERGLDESLDWYEAHLGSS